MRGPRHDPDANATGDCANDPLGHPNSEVGADPSRPYVSISIAHGIRRFEFMIHGDESDEEADSPEFVRRMLATMVPDPERVDIIRHRVYTHHSRIAGAFRQGDQLDASVSGSAGEESRHHKV